MENLLNHRWFYVGLALIIVLLTITLSSIISRIFRRYILRSAAIINNDPTNYKFLRHALVGLIYLVGFSLAIYMIPSFRSLAQSLLAGAGILAVAVGFASQQALSNIVAGLFIIIFKPFRVNDRVTIQNLSTGQKKCGQVKRL